jgi:hypothetical protein
LYVKIAASLEGIEVKEDTIRNTSLNGSKGKTGIRLPEKESEEFLKK